MIWVHDCRGPPALAILTVLQQIHQQGPIFHLDLVSSRFEHLATLCDASAIFNLELRLSYLLFAEFRCKIHLDDGSGHVDDNNHDKHCEYLHITQPGSILVSERPWGLSCLDSILQMC